MNYDDHKQRLIDEIAERNEALKNSFPEFEHRAALIIADLVSQVAMYKARDDRHMEEVAGAAGAATGVSEAMQNATLTGAERERGNTEYEPDFQEEYNKAIDHT